MAVFVLDENNNFPPVHLAEPDGLLAMGGSLAPAQLLSAYHRGIFPWYDGDTILWWSPDPRFVLFPQNLYTSKSMKQVIRSGRFTFTINKAFDQVIEHCRKTKRAEQDGTWITPEVETAYKRLHQLGHAHSAEAWLNGELAGGLYGVRTGRLFCGESMFSLQPNASKFAFIQYAQFLQQDGVELIDCQVYTEHLESLGAEMIPRSQFLEYTVAGATGT
ncbi:MAG: leucyl/phenylalanyl-tRNA--protein transferase, partial [Dinghuibacter sp.]|nr:leucyl/phenylalanyl-tRNA--protein transferase [Dinghuibacter sp.]